MSFRWLINYKTGLNIWGAHIWYDFFSFPEKKKKNLSFEQMEKALKRSYYKYYVIQQQFRYLMVHSLGQIVFTWIRFFRQFQKGSGPTAQSWMLEKLWSPIRTLWKMNNTWTITPTHSFLKLLEMRYLSYRCTVAWHLGINHIRFVESLKKTFPKKLDSQDST